MAATDRAKLIKADTKECITTAIFQLLEKENLSMITISKVCRRAGVSRAAFYRNFNGLEQVLYEYFQPKFSSIFEIISKEANESIKFQKQANFFEDLAKEFLLSAEGGFEFIIQKIFIDEMEKYYSNISDKYILTFMSSGVYALWRKWLLDGQKKPLAEIHQLLRKVNVSINF